MAKEIRSNVANETSGASRGHAGILDTLEVEHAELAELMNQVTAHGDELEARLQLYARIRKLLLVHGKAEEAELYPVLRREAPMQSLISEAKDQHQAMERLIAQIDRTPVDAPAWFDLFEQLQDDVERHVHREENQLFPACREALEASTLRDMDSRYKRCRESVKEQIADLEPARHPGYRPSV